MDVVYKRSCGLDVHKKRVVACVITPEGHEIRTFGAMTEDLLELADWLVERRVSPPGHGEHRGILETYLQSGGGYGFHSAGGER